MMNDELFGVIKLELEFNFLIKNNVPISQINKKDLMMIVAP